MRTVFLLLLLAVLAPGLIQHVTKFKNSAGTVQLNINIQSAISEATSGNQSLILTVNTTQPITYTLGKCDVPHFSTIEPLLEQTVLFEDACLDYFRMGSNKECGAGVQINLSAEVPTVGYFTFNLINRSRGKDVTVPWENTDVIGRCNLQLFQSLQPEMYTQHQNLLEKIRCLKTNTTIDEVFIDGPKSTVTSDSIYGALGLFTVVILFVLIAFIGAMIFLLRETDFSFARRKRIHPPLTVMRMAQNY